MPSSIWRVIGECPLMRRGGALLRRYATASQPRANLGAPFDFKRPLRVVWLPKCHGTSAGAVLSASPRRISAGANLNRTPLLELELSINSQEAL